MKTLTNDEMIAKAQPFLKKHPKATKAYVTEDGNVFMQKHYAAAHAKAVGIKCIEVDPLVVTDTQATSETSEFSEDVKAQLSAFDLNDDCNWNELQTLGKLCDVEAKTKAEYLEALRTLKATLKTA